MKFTDCFTLHKKLAEAEQLYDRTAESLDVMETAFVAKTEGKTPENMASDRKMTFAWLAGLTVFFCFCRSRVDGIFFPIAVLAAIALIVAMLKDGSGDQAYVDENFGYVNRIAQLKDRVLEGRAALGDEYDEFMEARTNGWDYPLDAGASVIDEMDELEAAVNGTAKQEGNQMSQIKNALFFANAILLTIVSGLAFSGVSAGIANNFHLSNETEIIVRVLSFVAACVAEGFFAKLMWSKTNLEVTNKTLLAFAPALLLFIGCAIVGSIIAYLITAVVEIVLAVIMFVSVVACLGCTSCVDDYTRPRWWW